MAGVLQPLFSESASGNMGKGALQFRSDKWGTHVYKPLVPAQQNKGAATVAQAAQRAKFSVVRDGWQLLSNTEKLVWQGQAVAEGYLSGWNLYISVGLAKSIYPDDTLLCGDNLPLLVEYGEIIQID